ncbi:MAG: ABC transporter substrate-binding protein [Gammaproteobacteria bacterium]
MAAHVARRCYSALLAFALVALFCTTVQAREIVDMAGHRVEVPDKVSRVYGASPPDQWLLYAIDPKLIAARHNSQPDSPLLPYSLDKLPVITGFVRSTPVNIEAIVNLKPDSILLWEESPNNENFLKTMAAAHVPVLMMKHRTHEDIIAGLRLIGTLTGNEARARALTDYAETSAREIRAAVDSIPQDRKSAVYLNDNADNGLDSRCDTSMHAEILKFAGARVVPECKTESIIVNAQLSFEQLLAYDPDVILTSSPVFLQSAKSDPRWKLLKTVRNGRVYLMPRTPLTWISRPPSFMRILGAKWVASLLYPDRYKPDMVKETQAFYRLFLKIEINDGQAREILQGK